MSGSAVRQRRRLPPPVGTLRLPAAGLSDDAGGSAEIDGSQRSSPMGVDDDQSAKRQQQPRRGGGQRSGPTGGGGQRSSPTGGGGGAEKIRVAKAAGAGGDELDGMDRDELAQLAREEMNWTEADCAREIPYTLVRAIRAARSARPAAVVARQFAGGQRNSPAGGDSQRSSHVGVDGQRSVHAGGDGKRSIPAGGGGDGGGGGGGGSVSGNAEVVRRAPKTRIATTTTTATTTTVSEAAPRVAATASEQASLWPAQQPFGAEQPHGQHSSPLGRSRPTGDGNGSTSATTACGIRKCWHSAIGARRDSSPAGLLRSEGCFACSLAVGGARSRRGDASNVWARTRTRRCSVASKSRW